MNKTPMFSIIMPVYNNETYLPKAVESIFYQDFEDYELIIVDDGSTDNTAFLADEYARSNDKVKVIHQDNQWIYASFNRGIREASGDYIYILNSDDRLRVNAFKLMSSVVERYHPDAILTKVLAHMCDEKQNIVKYDVCNLDLKIIEDKYYACEEEIHNAWPSFFENRLIYNQANLYKRSIILQHPFRNDVHGADLLFNIDIASEIHTIYVLASPIYDFFYYDRNDMNASYRKYYDYEHQMNNEIYTKYTELYQKWELDTKFYKPQLMKWRINRLTGEIRSLNAQNCSLFLEDKIRKILNCFIDDLMCDCAKYLDRQEEMESRALSEIRNLLLRESLLQTSEMYFVYELLESLLRYEKTAMDYKRIDMATNHPLNPHHVGRTFADKLQRNDITAF